MQIKRRLALVVISLSGALLSASCVQKPATPEPEGDGASATPTPKAGGTALEEELREDVGETAEAFGKVIHCTDDESNVDCAEPFAARKPSVAGGRGRRPSA